jgi:hypothetical protein
MRLRKICLSARSSLTAWPLINARACNNIVRKIGRHPITRQSHQSSQEEDADVTNDVFFGEDDISEIQGIAITPREPEQTRSREGKQTARILEKVRILFLWGEIND